MKVFIIAATSADGYIAKDSVHPAFWTSKEDKKRFVDLTSKAGVVVMGSQTYKTLPRPLKERTNIVYSRSQHFEGTETTQATPHELIEELRGRGFTEVAICGGSQIYTMFMDARVVTHIYLTVEPIIFGKGITMFNKVMNHHLELLSSETTPSGTVLVEYRVNYHGTQGE